MKTITLTVDETQQAQVVWSSDLNVFLRLYAIQQTDVQNDIVAAQEQMATATASIQNLNALIASVPVQAQQAQIP